MDSRGLPSPEEMARRIHNTLVAPEATYSDLKAFCLEAKEQGFGAVVIQGCWVSEVKGLLRRELDESERNDAPE